MLEGAVLCWTREPGLSRTRENFFSHQDQEPQVQQQDRRGGGWEGKQQERGRTERIELAAADMSNRVERANIMC